MILGVSNIAWNFKDEDYFLNLLKENGIKYLEIAPFKIKNSWDLTTSDLIEYKKKLASFGIIPYSMQAVLFGLKENLFENPEVLHEHFSKIILPVCKILEIKKVVFGSPSNRRVPERMNDDEAKRLFVKFFSDLSYVSGEICPETVICIEPNSKIYNCNFTTNASEGLDIIDLIDRENIKLHLDTANMFLEDDNEIHILNEHVKHFHVSEPHLKDFSNPKNTHKIYSEFFKKSKIESISIEKLSTNDKNTDEIELLESIKFCRENYI